MLHFVQGLNEDEEEKPEYDQEELYEVSWTLNQPMMFNLH